LGAPSGFILTISPITSIGTAAAVRVRPLVTVKVLMKNMFGITPYNI
jgi:hypothetical protein